MRTFFILLPILASLYGAITPTTGEINTIEALLTFRKSKANVWRDVLTNEPLYRVNNAGEFVQAARDEDITLSPFNAGTIMGSYLSNPSSVPQATFRSTELTGLVNNLIWNKLLILAKNYRASLGRIAKDCLGNDLFELVESNNRKPAADIRDIVDIPSLIAAVEPAIRAALPLPAKAPLAFSEALANNFSDFLDFRTTQNDMRLDPRTNQKLYRIVNDTLVPAARDSDVKPDLSNLVLLMREKIATGSSAARSCLPGALSDQNIDRLYRIVEEVRRAQGHLAVDAAGRPLYLETRVQAVDMQDVTDAVSLVKAVFGFFAENLRPAL